ncbi:MAG: rhodanese-like domain-containing protein [Cellvibrionaceae bacterium]|nr:rhodanese-like domain-containing protein [Cellvibrionaceae bacterium]
MLRVLLISFVLFSAAIASDDNSLMATHVLSPEDITGATKVDAEQLIALIERTDNLTIIDSRIKSDRRQGFIEGSISLPDIETNCEALSAAINSFSSPVVFYCNGVKCGRSANAVTIAIGCGYKEIYWFRTGIEEWMEEVFPLSIE